MKMTKKKKISAVALAVCLITVMSAGTLAWFTDEDLVTNKFMVAGSEEGNPEDIFSVDVWEEGVDENDDGLTFEDILPGDTLEKVAHVKNTGSYDEYIRVKIEVSDAKVWQDVYKANMVPVTEFVNVDKVAAWSDVYADGNGKTVHAALEGDSFAYYLYYKTPLKADDKTTDAVENGDIVVFNEAYISGHLTKEQAVELNKDGNDGFTIKVTADAVQTENVGDNVYEAFKTVGMEIPVNTTYINNFAELEAALKEDGFIVLMNDIEYEFGMEIQKNNNLYLNDYTMTPATTKGKPYKAMIVKGNVIVGGYGTLNMPGDTITGIVVSEGGILSIYGGYFEDTQNRDANRDESLIFVQKNGVLNIYGGIFNGADLCVDAEAGATVNVAGDGGKFSVKSTWHENPIRVAQ